MAVIKCPECGRKISDQANVCTHCGYPISKTITANDLENPSSPTESVIESDCSQPVVSSKKKKTKIKLTIICIAIILFAIGVYAVKTMYDQKAIREKDLSDALEISFYMTKEDIIAYESLTYGHTEVEYLNEDVLGFEPYTKKDKTDYRHIYYFDENTGLLKFVYYADVTESLPSLASKDSKCKHINDVKKKLFKVVGYWDEESHEGYIKYVYGQIDGVPCTITYFDGAFQELHISREDD